MRALRLCAHTSKMRRAAADIHFSVRNLEWCEFFCLFVACVWCPVFGCMEAKQIDLNMNLMLLQQKWIIFMETKSRILVIFYVK